MLTGSYSWPYRRLMAIHYTSGRMPLGEADTRAKLIDPALHARGWSEDLIRREETAGAVEVVGERARRRPKGRVDYTLRVKVNAASQPVAVALLEAKAEHLPPAHGLEQAKPYAVGRRLTVLLEPVRRWQMLGLRLEECDRYGLAGGVDPESERVVNATLWPPAGTLTNHLDRAGRLLATAQILGPPAGVERGGDQLRSSVGFTERHASRSMVYGQKTSGWP